MRTCLKMLMRCFRSESVQLTIPQPLGYGLDDNVEKGVSVTGTLFMLDDCDEEEEQKEEEEKENDVGDDEALG